MRYQCLEIKQNIPYVSFIPRFISTCKKCLTIQQKVTVIKLLSREPVKCYVNSLINY